MAFLRRRLGRQGVGSCGPRAQPNPECGTSGVGFHPGASGLDGTLLKGGVTRTSSWGTAWDKGHHSLLGRGGDGQAFVTWLGAIPLLVAVFKIKRFISGWLVPTMLFAVASLHSPVLQPFLLATVPLATVTQIQAHIKGDHGRSRSQTSPPGGDAPTGLDPSSYRHRSHF